MRTGAAADFWNRYEEDFARCRAMGLKAFRLSIEWPRVQPLERRKPLIRRNSPNSNHYSPPPDQHAVRSTLSAGPALDQPLSCTTRRPPARRALTADLPNHRVVFARVTVVRVLNVCPMTTFHQLTVARMLISPESSEIPQKLLQ